MDISGIAALVTGGGSGLGAATAEALAAAGAHVVVMDLRQEAAAAVAARIGGVAVAGDVAEEGRSRRRWMRPRPWARCGWR
ncbi:SDR family NAD(P)-dependent oxidoreductase [Paeniroseomonas aquatica]